MADRRGVPGRTILWCESHETVARGYPDCEWNRVVLRSASDACHITLALIATQTGDSIDSAVPVDIDALVDILIARHGGKHSARREFEITAWLLIGEWRKWA